MRREQPHPVRLVVADDLRRPRLTVLFRLFLLVPQLLWGLVWSFLVGATVPFAWLLALFSGRVWPDLHALNARFLRWYTHVTAYAHVLAGPYPRFDGRPGYPIDVEVAPAERQPRLVTAFRLVLALPALVLVASLGVVLGIVAVLGWFVCLALGRMPRGLRDLGAYIVHFSAQTIAYLMVLTSRYPSLTYDPIVPVVDTASLSLEDGPAGGSGRP